MRRGTVKDVPLFVFLDTLVKPTRRRRSRKREMSLACWPDEGMTEEEERGGEDGVLSMKIRE